MNIFATSDCPRQSALWMDDRRVNKMIVESAQMASTNLRMYNVLSDRLYQSAYHNHPCTVWARLSRENHLWLVLHGLHLCSVYTSVFRRSHKTEDILRLCLSYTNSLPAGEQTMFANCSLVKRIDVPVVDCYRQTMNIKWARDNVRPTWNNRNRPSWYENLG